MSGGRKHGKKSETPSSTRPTAASDDELELEQQRAEFAHDELEHGELEHGELEEDARALVSRSSDTEEVPPMPGYDIESSKAMSLRRLYGSQ